MADTFSKEKRSLIMSRIRSKDTSPEMVVRKYLFNSGYRYRLHSKLLPGRPDMVLPKYKTVIFVHGCFWHGHFNCNKAGLPKTRTDWWKAKIDKNMNNDICNRLLLEELGWKVVIIWQCELRKNRDEVFAKMASSLKG
jgi:DNA mismatch endonuclease, patch repair protein